MKKLSALLMALCMLLAAVPALGDGPSGVWYMVLADVTVGYFQLDEDGAAKGKLPGQDELTGTWTADDATVTLTFDGQSLPFAYDGTSLSSDALPIPIVREEGKLSYDLIEKITSGQEYELPEGMTEADIMAIALNFLSEFKNLQGAASGDSGDSGDAGDAEPAASAGPELTFLGESFKVVESYSGFRGVYIAKVQNNTSEPLYIKDGAMQVTDASGAQAGEAKYLSTTGSKYLEPGEVSFISMEADLAENGEYTYTKEIEVTADAWRTDTAVTVTDPVFVPAQDYDSAWMKATVVNDTENALPGVRVVYALLDAEGSLLDLREESLYRHELCAGSSITMVTSLDGKTEEYLAANGVEPASVEAYAWVENK